MELIFKEIIKKWHQIDHKQNAYNEKQLTNLLFRQNIDIESVELALEYYTSYFDRVKRYLYLPKWDKFTRDFPSWFDVTVAEDHEVMKAFTDEEYAIEDDHAKLWILAKVFREIPNPGYGYLYEALISLPDGVATPGQEGIPINLWWKEASENNNIQGVFLAYYRKTSVFIFRVSQQLSDEHVHTTFRFKPKPLSFLKHIKERFNCVKTDPSNLTHQLFYKDGFLRTQSHNKNLNYAGFNASQKAALERVFSQNVTFIWGPPGTGKTYTLSKIITQACALGLRVLAVGISNVSVDILGQEIIKEFENYNDASRLLLNDRKLLRFGYPVLPEIVNDDRLYPDKDIVDQLRKEYGEVLKRLRSSNPLSIEEKAVIRNQQVLLQQEIKQSNQKRISASRLVFTTAAQCFIGGNFDKEKFDLVVVDEVGMMPLIQTLTMASFTSDKFLVAGDFKQLGPISIGKTEAVNNWFNSDVFQYFKNVAGFEEEDIVMLTEQRRMHPQICELINDRFYNGKLTSFYSEKYQELKTENRTIESPYCFIPIDPKDGSVVKSTAGRSRVNNKTAQVVIDLVESILKNNETLDIGIITPYNGQVISLRRKLNTRTLSNEQRDRVKIGTIHSFQGSGFDVIIYDIVDNSEKAIGNLYKGIQGERLVNVALSRAKHKLIIIGDPKVFSIADEHEQVSKKLRSLMVALRMSGFQVNLDSFIG
ncbi:MAG: AAA domain-containing protein [Gelidibacter sp.]